MFIEFEKEEYRSGGYITIKIMFALRNIVRVVECGDDHRYTNIITKDGTVHTVKCEYSEVAKKIRVLENLKK